MSVTPTRPRWRRRRIGPAAASARSSCGRACSARRSSRRSFGPRCSPVPSPFSPRPGGRRRSPGSGRRTSTWMSRAEPRGGPGMAASASRREVMPDTGLARAGALLSIDLGAVRANSRLLRQHLGGTACAAVVKADAYGLGAARVAPALAAEGCRHFFVAHLDEAIALRPHLPAAAELFVLNGVPPGAEAECLEHHATPVLNSLAQVEAWAGLARSHGRPLPAILQVDTGMSRSEEHTSELQSRPYLVCRL